MDEILDRINTVESQIATVKSKVAHRDLRKMLAGLDRTITQMSREDVECRRTKRTTSRYRELEQQARDQLTYLEQMITFAALLG